MASSAALLCHTIAALQREFMMKDMCSLHHFFRVTAERRTQDLFLHQRQYYLVILEY